MIHTVQDTFSSSHTEPQKHHLRSDINKHTCGSLGNGRVREGFHLSGEINCKLDQPFQTAAIPTI